MKTKYISELFMKRQGNKSYRKWFLPLQQNSYRFMQHFFEDFQREVIETTAVDLSTSFPVFIN